MHNKIIVNEKMMLTEILKKVYVQNQVSGNTLTQLEPQLRKNNTQPFATANEMFDTLTSAFGNPNRKQIACTKYQTFWQEDYEFSNFWVKFQWLAADLNHSKETLIDDITNPN